jgi:uncharacterized repeat protein (TIGR02543 family)
VTFDSNSGSAVPDVGAYNAPIAKPADLTRTGFTFIGWHTNAELTQVFNFSTSITSDITLYAKWNVVSQPPTNISGNTKTGDNYPIISVCIAGVASLGAGILLFRKRRYYRVK